MVQRAPSPSFPAPGPSAPHVAPARGLVEVHVDALQLQVAVTLLRARRVHAVLVRDHLPELAADLVAALAALNGRDLTHDEFCVCVGGWLLSVWFCQNQVRDNRVNAQTRWFLRERRKDAQLSASMTVVFK